MLALPAIAATMAFGASCPRGAASAYIAGRRQCLAVGKRCDPRVSYRRYGFACQGDTKYRTTLFKIVGPGPAPTLCPGLGPTPISVPAYSTTPAAGEAPFWVRPSGVRIDAPAGVWHLVRPRLGIGGWQVSWAWLPEARAVPAHVSITDFTHGGFVAITIKGDVPSTFPLLDERNALIDPENAWRSLVVFPGAGCYRVVLDWPYGSRTISFSFGR